MADKAGGNGKEKLSIPRGFFDFTKPLPHRSDLHDWETWFRKNGIKTKVIQNSKKLFILCRQGTPSDMESARK